MVDFGGLMGLALGDHALAERVEGHSHSLLVDCVGNAQGVFDFHPGDEAGTQLDSHAGALTEMTQNAVSGQGNKSRPEQRHKGAWRRERRTTRQPQNISFAHWRLWTAVREGT